MVDPRSHCRRNVRWQPFFFGNSMTLSQARTTLRLSFSRTKAEVKALAFCPLEQNQLASGSSDGQVTITDVSSEPPVTQILPATSSVEVTQIAWNTQVQHIVAVAHADGLVAVWDLKQMKPWCQLRSPEAISDIQWNPTEGLHLVTASLDDRNPIIKLWDLRASTSMPLATLRGHSQGILSLDWCPHDETLMVRCVVPRYMAICRTD